MSLNIKALNLFRHQFLYQHIFKESGVVCRVCLCLLMKIYELLLLDRYSVGKRSMESLFKGTSRARVCCA